MNNNIQPNNSLNDIGFYTLSDNRCKNATQSSQLQRCELLITSKCNFKCPYCRGTDKSANITYEQAHHIVHEWTLHGLKNIRFSGGEPTIVQWLPDIVEYSRNRGIERIALSTNGSASIHLYDELISKGVNDFSISLDACCSSIGDMMTGDIKGMWQKVVANIKDLSSMTYVTIGVVLTEDNIHTVNDIVSFASDELGASDIRLITAAQYNKQLDNITINQRILDKHPILKYRWNNIKNNRHVRGIKENDNHRCPLSLDDMAVKGNHHYPCIIKMREGCNPIGSMDDIRTVRLQRKHYAENHNTFNDPACKNNCLDVCIDYNNKYKELHNN